MFEGTLVTSTLPSYYSLFLTGSGKMGMPVSSIFDLELYHWERCIKAVPLALVALGCLYTGSGSLPTSLQRLLPIIYLIILQTNSIISGGLNWQRERRWCMLVSGRQCL